jgi:hypothetical protein
MQTHQAGGSPMSHEESRQRSHSSCMTIEGFPDQVAECGLGFDSGLPTAIG